MSSVYFNPLMVSDDGKTREPAPPGRKVSPDVMPLDPDKANLLELGEAGFKLTAGNLVSELEHNPIISNVDGKLYFRAGLMLSPDDKVMQVSDNLLFAELSLCFDAQSSKLTLLGKDGTVVSELLLPVAPGLPTVVEILPDTIPPKPEGFVENPYPRSTYLHMRFRLADDKDTDIYIDVSKLADIYHGGPGIDITPDKTVSLNVALKLDGNNFLLLGKDNQEIASAVLPFTDETLTAAELLTGFTPPPEHGQQASPLPESNYLHLHFDSVSGSERDMYVDMGKVGGTGATWVRRVEGPMPTGAALEALVADMPEGALVYATDGGVVYLTRADTDKLYVALSGNQTIDGVKTFAESPLAPTSVSGDKSGKVATTEFVGNALDDVVKLEGDQEIAGVKTFAVSPVVPTPEFADNSDKVATTGFVQNALALFGGNEDWVKRVEGALPTGATLDALLSDMPEGGLIYYTDSGEVVTFLTQSQADDRYVQLGANQVINGEKTFTVSPRVPTVETSDNSTKVASTAFVQAAIASVETQGGGVALTGDQAIGGVKTFTDSPLVPTLANGDNSKKAASTAFVQSALAGLDAASVNAVSLSGDQAVAGVKTFTDSPVVPTPDDTDNSTKVATTAYVQTALSTINIPPAGVTLTGNQTVEGVKTFTDSPVVPTPEAGDDSDKVATTAFIMATPWFKVVNGPLPDDVSEVVADMPIGGLVLFKDEGED